ncbi:hypothetical protein NDU88_003916 [Pleurodeles waltl]|uniref:Uncharacterized protein n=1 Tax=Pleurodeles waltl TaxID=8319 RepID=A0AAV7WTL3_PLEWA|nr:hypothetical protein NDU88_003916 [Pleurodeles waltl]
MTTIVNLRQCLGNLTCGEVGAELAEPKDGRAVAELLRLPKDPSKSCGPHPISRTPWGGGCSHCRGEDSTVGRLRRDPVWAPCPVEVLEARAGAGRPGPRDGVMALAPACRRAAGKFLRRVVMGPTAPRAGVGARLGAALVGAAELWRSPSGAGGTHCAPLSGQRRSGTDERRKGLEVRLSGKAESSVGT